MSLKLAPGLRVLYRPGLGSITIIDERAGQEFSLTLAKGDLISINRYIRETENAYTEKYFGAADETG